MPTRAWAVLTLGTRQSYLPLLLMLGAATLQVAPLSTLVITSTVEGSLSLSQVSRTVDPAACEDPATGAASVTAFTRITSVATKQSMPMLPPTLTVTAFPAESNAATSARLNLTVRSGIPSPSASPIEAGAPLATDTDPSRRTEDTSMSPGP